MTSTYLFSRRPRSLGALLCALLLPPLLVACGDRGDVGSSKLRSLQPGTTRAQLLSAIGTGSVTGEGADTLRLRNGHRIEEFFQDGIQYSVFWYREEPGTVADTVRRATDTPVVFYDDSMTGWGWDFYMQWASEKGIPKPPQ